MVGLADNETAATNINVTLTTNIVKLEALPMESKIRKWSLNESQAAHQAFKRIKDDYKTWV
jgi:hypothetical protein